MCQDVVTFSMCSNQCITVTEAHMEEQGTDAKLAEHSMDKVIVNEEYSVLLIESYTYFLVVLLL